MGGENWLLPSGRGGGGGAGRGGFCGGGRRGRRGGDGGETFDEESGVGLLGGVGEKFDGADELGVELVGGLALAKAEEQTEGFGFAGGEHDALGVPR